MGPAAAESYLRVDEPYLCVCTDSESVAFIAVLEDFTDYRITVTLWRLA